jgi:hypothetical protein
MCIISACVSIIKLDVELLKACILFSGVSILLRFIIWKYHLEENVYNNPKRTIKIDFSVFENNEEIFYQRINFKANDIFPI